MYEILKRRFIHKRFALWMSVCKLRLAVTMGNFSVAMATINHKLQSQIQIDSLRQIRATFIHSN